MTHLPHLSRTITSPESQPLQQGDRSWPWNSPGWGPRYYAWSRGLPRGLTKVSGRISDIPSRLFQRNISAQAVCRSGWFLRTVGFSCKMTDFCSAFQWLLSVTLLLILNAFFTLRLISLRPLLTAEFLWVRPSVLRGVIQCALWCALCSG